MDMVASVCSSIVACAAEWKKYVNTYMEILKKSFGIGQQCGCTNANVKRKANKEKEDYKVGRRSNARGGEAEEMEEAKKVGREMGKCCAGYYEVDLLLTLYIETGR